MTQVVSSISGLEIYSPSAGHAPTNSGDVSAIASGYQVVSSTATQLYAGTAYLTGVNGAPVSASRAGQAANASMANSAYYDGTGRLISALPDSAAVSSIASAYAESAASGKLDSTAFSTVSGDFLTAETVSSIVTAQYGPQPTDVGVTAINGFGLVAKSADTAYSAVYASIALTDVNLRALTSLADSAAVSAIASSYAESAVSGKSDASSLSSYALSSDVSGVIDTVSTNSASWGVGGAAFPADIESAGTVRAVVTTGFQGDVASRPTLFISSNPSTTAYPRMMLSENHETTGKSGAFLADAFEFYSGTGIKVFRVDPTGVSATKFFLGSASVRGNKWGLNPTSVSGNKWDLNSASVSGGTGTATWQYGTAEYNQLTSVHDTVSANSASWGQGGVVTSTGSSTYWSAGNEYTVVNRINGSSLGAVTSYSANSAYQAVYDQSGRRLDYLPDTAKVSAIASSYAESAVSGKMDTSAIDYTRTGGGTQIYASGTGSSTNLISAYNESAGVSMMVSNTARLRLWDSAATANIYASSVNAWNDTTDLVANQSSSWSTNADWEQTATSSPAYIENKPDLVDIVAGPGIVVDNPDGNTLRVSMDSDYEVELYSGTKTSNGLASFTLSEYASSFDRIRFYGIGYGNTKVMYECPAPDTSTEALSVCYTYYCRDTDNNPWQMRMGVYTSTNGLDYSIRQAKFLYGGDTALAFGGGNTTQNPPIYRIVGIKRIAGGN